MTYKHFPFSCLNKMFMAVKVLLYNFFQDSAMDVSQWRVVLNALGPGRSAMKAPCFNEIHHAGLCTEVCVH
jgi:hypothetical protein